MTDWKAAQAKAWATRRKRHGPRGHMAVQKWRRKPSARAKRIIEQGLIANVSCETEVSPASPAPDANLTNGGSR
jgi:hypothetical protein